MAKSNVTKLVSPVTGGTISLDNAAEADIEAHRLQGWVDAEDKPARPRGKQSDKPDVKAGRAALRASNGHLNAEDRGEVEPEAESAKDAPAEQPAVVDNQE